LQHDVQGSWQSFRLLQLYATFQVLHLFLRSRVQIGLGVLRLGRSFASKTVLLPSIFSTSPIHSTSGKFTSRPGGRRQYLFRFLIYVLGGLHLLGTVTGASTSEACIHHEQKKSCANRVGSAPALVRSSSGDDLPWGWPGTFCNHL